MSAFPLAKLNRVLGNVRRRGRSRWQARVWCAAERHGWVNVGVYETEEAASQVARRVLKVMKAAGVVRATALDVWRAAVKLSDDGFDVGGQLGSLLPMYVCGDGAGGYGYRRRGGNGMDRGGYVNPEEAYRAAVKARGKVKRKGMRAVVMVQMSLLGLIGLEADEKAVPVTTPRRERRRRAGPGGNHGQLTFDALIERFVVSETRSAGESLSRSA